jgi:nucleotide-binding universal stress UspA family protein
MKLSKIMVYQDDNVHCVNWTTYAAHLASQYSASLTGVFVGPDTNNLGMLDDALMKAIKKNIVQANQPAGLAKEQFQKTISAFDVPSSFVIAHEDAAIALRREARFFNLVVTGQPDTSASAIQDEKGALSHLLMGSGRPVIVVPRGYTKKPDFSRITIAWDGGRESTRAFFDSLPFIEQATSVELITIRSKDHSRPFSIARTDEISNILQKMGIKAFCKVIDAKGKRSGQLILESAQYHNSSLIVMGAYGHSRLREMVLGSATRSLIMKTDIPIFMSH